MNILIIDENGDLKELKSVKQIDFDRDSASEIIIVGDRVCIKG